MALGLAVKTDGKTAIQVAGTKRCMAPELQLGEWAVIGFTADSWSFGVMVYEFLVGRKLFNVASISQAVLRFHVDDIAATKPLSSFCLAFRKVDLRTTSLRDSYYFNYILFSSPFMIALYMLPC